MLRAAPLCAWPCALVCQPCAVLLRAVSVLPKPADKTHLEHHLARVFCVVAMPALTLQIGPRLYDFVARLTAVVATFSPAVRGTEEEGGGEDGRAEPEGGRGQSEGNPLPTRARVLCRPPCTLCAEQQR